MPAETYSRVGDFTDDESANASGRSTVSTATLDAELDAAATAISAHAADLDVLLRDDGKLTDAILRGHEFSGDALSILSAALSTSSLVWRGAWAPTTAYAVRDVVYASGAGSYVCIVAHTSAGAFSVGSNWLLIAADGAAGAIVPGPIQTASNLNLDATYHFKTIEVTETATITLPDAATVGNGYTVTITNAIVAGATVTIARTTGSDTIDLTAANFSLLRWLSVTLQVNAAANGYLIISARNLAYFSAAAIRSDISAMENVITTRGDLVVGNSSNVPVRLARGNANDILTTTGSGDAAWTTTKACLTGAFNGNPGVPGGIWYVPFCGVVPYTVSNSKIFTCPVAGKLGGFYFRAGTNNTSGSVTITVMVNGVATSIAVTVTNTALFQDTSNSALIHAGSNISLMLNWAAGSGEMSNCAWGIAVK